MTQTALNRLSIKHGKKTKDLFNPHRNILFFDGNSNAAYLLARTVLIHDQQHLFDLMPKQNAEYFCKSLSANIGDEQLLILTQDGIIYKDDKAIHFISEQLHLEKIYYH